MLGWYNTNIETPQFLFFSVSTIPDSPFITLYHQCLWCKVNTYLIRTRVLCSVNNNITKNAFLIIYSFYFPLLFIVTTFLFFLKKQTQQFYAMSRRSSNFLLFNRFSSCSHTSLCLCHLRLPLSFDVYVCVCYCKRKIHFSVYFLSFVAFLIDILRRLKRENL